MIHKINFEIRFESNVLQEQDYAEIMDIIEAQMKENHPDGIPFEEFTQIVPLKESKFHPTAIQYSDLYYDDEYSIKETKIEIKV
jgi:hypothetical protein